MSRYRVGIGKIGENELGLGKYTTIVFGLLIGVAVYCGNFIIPFYYNFFEIQNQMQTLCDVASINTDKQMRTKLKYHLRKNNIPVDIDDVKMNRGTHMYTMSMEYDEVFEVYIPWEDEYYEVHTFEFNAFAEADIEE